MNHFLVLLLALFISPLAATNAEPAATKKPAEKSALAVIDKKENPEKKDTPPEEQKPIESPSPEVTSAESHAPSDDEDIESDDDDLLEEATMPNAESAPAPPESAPLLDDDDDDLLLSDDDDDEDIFKELEEDDGPIVFKDLAPDVKDPLIQTEEERNAPDPDPGNREAFPNDGGGFQDPEKIDPELLKDDGSYKPLTKEELEKKKQENEAERNKLMGAALKKESAKVAQSKKRDDIFAVTLKGLKEAGVDITKDGFGFTGKRYFWTDQYVRLTFALTLGGLLAQGYMNELKLGPLHISGVGPDGQYGTDDDGVIVELRVDKKKQRFMASGMIDILAALARCDIIFGTDAFTFFTHLQLLKKFEVKFLAESRGKGSNLDFVVMGALKSDFLKFLEEIASEAVGDAGQLVGDGIEAVRKEIMKAKVIVKKMKQAQKKMGQEFMKHERAYKRKTRHAEKVIAPLRKTVRRMEKTVGKLKSQIWNIRRKLIAGREKSIAGIRKAIRTVNKARAEVDRAKRALRRAKKRTKWYKPWTYAVVAYQAGRLAVVEAARWTAEKVLKGLIGLINLWPIDATPPLPALWAAYGAAVASLKTAHASLSAAMLASNPLAMKEMSLMIGLAVAMGSNQLAIIGAQYKLFQLKVTLMAYEAAARTAGEAASAGLKAGMSVVNALTPLKIIGGSVVFSLRNLARGKLPEIGLNTRFFGAKRNVKLAVDLANPVTFATAFPKMLIDVLGGSNRNDDVSKHIESARLKYKDQFDALDRARIKAEGSKSAWQKKDEARKAEIEKLNADNASREASVAAIDTISKGDGEFGKKLDLEKDVKDVKKADDAPVDIFNPAKPDAYTCKNRFNQFRWTKEWQLPTAGSGTVIFNAMTDRDIQVGLHAGLGQPKDRTCDVIIGFAGNRSTVVRNAKSEVLTERRAPEAIVQKKPTNLFWVSYHHGFVSCGHGIQPGKNIILEWQLPNPAPKITHFSFSCHNNKIIFTSIKTKPAYEGPFGTRYSVYEGFNNCTWHEQLKLPAADQGTLVFKARTERDIVIGLTGDTKKSQATYLCSVGMEGNSISSLTHIKEDKYQRIAMTQDREALVSGAGKEYADYWCTFNKGHFAFGTGSNPKENVILEALEAAPATGITHASFSSWDNAVDYQDIKVMPVVPIPFGSTYSAVNRALHYHWRKEWLLNTPGKGTIQWYAKGTDDMAIGLHTSEDSNQKNKTYEFLIGTENNTRTILRDHAGKELIGTDDLEAVIAERNNHNPYWLSYDNGGPGKLGYIALGTGTEPGKNVILEYEGVTEKITHFSFSNQEGFVGFKKITSEKLVPVPRGQHYTAAAMKNRFHWRPEWQLPTPGNSVIVVNAQAKSDVTIGLHTKQDESPDNRTFDIIFGAQNNTSSLLRDHRKKVLRADKRSISRIQNTSSIYSYWVWCNQNEGFIAYGQGSTPGKKEIARHPIKKNSAPITHYSLSSGDSAVTYKNIAAYKPTAAALEKRIAKQKAKGTTINLPASKGAYDWRKEWQLTGKDAGTLAFSARTQAPFHIGFHDNPGAKGTEKTYEAVIGQEGISIHNANGALLAKTSDKDAVVTDDGNFFDYWINYYKGQIVIGKGSVPGDNIILETKDTQHKRGVSYFSFASSSGLARVRNIKTGKGVRYASANRFSASSLRGRFTWHKAWQFSEVDQAAITFEAKATHGVTIGLAKNDKSGPEYVITIGANGNTGTVISKGKPVVSVQKEHARIKKTESFEPYWLAYQQGYILVGHGDTVGANTIVSWQDPMPTSVMKHVSFTSGNNQVSYQNIAVDELKGELGSANSFVANGKNKQFTFSNKWAFPDHTGRTITFRAQATENVRIGLQDEDHMSTSLPAYEIVIGGKKNTTTSIKKDGKTVAQTTAPTALLNRTGNPQAFWVSYKDNKITVGRGPDPTRKAILTWADEAYDKSIKYFGFSGGDTQVKFANIKQMLYKKSDASRDYISRSKKGVYKVKPKKWRLKEPNSATIITEATADAEIMMGFFENTLKKLPLYDVVIGGDDNTTIILRKRDVKEKNMVEVAREEFSVEAVIPSYYWFSHHHGVISCGTGKKAGENQLVQWQDKNKKNNINFFGLTSGNSVVEYRDIQTSNGVKRSRSKFIVAMRRRGTMLWNGKWQLPQDKTLTINAEAPNADIYIGLRNEKKDTQRYTIRLGGWRNSKCAIIKDKRVVAELDKKIKLGTKRVWITNVADEKGHQRIVVGTGTPGHKVLLDWTDTGTPAGITHYGLSSGLSKVTFSNAMLNKPALPLTSEEKAAIEAKKQEKLEAKAARIRKIKEAKEEEELLSIDDSMPSLPVIPGAA